MVLEYGVVTGVSHLIVVGVDEVDFGVKGFHFATFIVSDHTC